jgi:hypothetical protein
MVAWHIEKNAETGRRKDTELIDTSLIENKISASVIDAAIEVVRHEAVLKSCLLSGDHPYSRMNQGF